MNFTTLQAAHLAAHQLRLRGYTAEVLDECAGGLYGQLFPAGFRVIVLDENEGEEASEVPAEEAATESECQARTMGAGEFLMICLITGAALAFFMTAPTALRALWYGAPWMVTAKELLFTTLFGAVIGIGTAPLMALGFRVISLCAQGRPVGRFLLWLLIAPLLLARVLVAVSH